jgi:hypothetical protein
MPAAFVSPGAAGPAHAAVATGKAGVPTTAKKETTEPHEPEALSAPDKAAKPAKANQPAAATGAKTAVPASPESKASPSAQSTSVEVAHPASANPPLGETPTRGNKRKEAQPDKEQAEPTVATVTPSHPSAKTNTVTLETAPAKANSPQDPVHTKPVDPSSPPKSEAPMPGPERPARVEAPAPLAVHNNPATPVLTPPSLPSANPDKSVSDSWTTPALPTGSAQLVDSVANDPGLSVTVLPHAAHLSIASSAGDLALHVRVRDGNADVNVSGSMAPLFDNKGPEVRTALASEGLSLGSFATDQHGNQQGRPNQHEPPTAEPITPPIPSVRRTTGPAAQHVATDDKRIHVTA